MIPYETVRAHLERRHWTVTTGIPWADLVALHEEAHHCGCSDPHHAQLPLVAQLPPAAVVDVAPGEFL